ncbi:hypothetical protein SteCoe_33825 [Stentor coeruleus]|uniref:Uncharacterized protein n=1 Tax=Stentor coeruleus TaxID=5963 RepID=A0A1R2AVY6_9CILI|nr:hypothetical protein SteCoe_33825 [Stentor coeruleus]
MSFSVEMMFQPVSELVGIPIDQTILIFCFVISVPLGWIQFYLLRGAIIRHIYSIICGLSLGLIQFGPKGLLHFAFSSLAVYIMLLSLPRKKVAFPILAFLIIYLSAMHIYRMITDWMGWKMDATGVQMLMTCKLSLLAYAYQDAEVIKTDENRVPLEQKKILVQKLPNLIEYYSYVCFYPSFSIGPSFEYKEYIDFINTKEEFKNIPNTLWPSFKILMFSFLCMGLTVIGDIYFPYMHCFTDEFVLHPFLYKVFYYNISMCFCKIRYTTAWKFTESAMIASGMGYTGKSKTGNEWERAVSINWKKAEYAWTAKEMVENWNISVSVWLRRCIFNRIIVSGKDPLKPSSTRKSLAQHSSYIFSAFWHGFYPAYYVMFFWFSITSEISKMVFISDWSWLPAKNTFKWIAWGLMWMICNHHGVIFLSLELSRALKFVKSIHYLPMILLIIGWSFFKVSGLHRRQKSKAS